MKSSLPIDSKLLDEDRLEFVFYEISDNATNVR